MSLADNVTASKAPKVHVETDAGGATVTNALFGTATPTFEDWGMVFRRFNLSPEDYEIVDDTVRMSSWDQSRRTETGDRDLIQLYSFSARFRRLPKGRLNELQVGEKLEEMAAWVPPKRTRDKRVKPPVSEVILPADLQAGKTDGGGVDALTDRLHRAMDQLDDKITKLRREKHLHSIALVNMGDLIEGTAGFYPTQTFGVELDLRGQIKYAAEFMLTMSKHFFPMADHGHFVTALSNHGELGRTGGGNKNTTTDHDSADGLLAEMLEMILRENKAFDHVQFHTPYDEMVTYAEIQGIPLGFLHGHKISGTDAGGFTKWLEAQQRGDQRAWEVDVWHVAHRHNFQMWDLGSCSALQMPSLDGGSKSLRDATGKFSRPALASYTLNPEAPLRWENLLLAAQENRKVTA